MPAGELGLLLRHRDVGLAAQLASVDAGEQALSAFAQPAPAALAPPSLGSLLLDAFA